MCSEVNNQVFSHFISQSPWNHRLLLKWIQNVWWRSIGKKGAIIIDECGNPKTGGNSVAVKRQYCGNWGKVENCQVGVFLAYAKQGVRLLLDFRLYQQESRVSDPQRCKSAGIPDNELVFRTKAEWHMI